jgi:hypothetical protein
VTPRWPDQIYGNPQRSHPSPRSLFRKRPMKASMHIMGISSTT